MNSEQLTNYYRRVHGIEEGTTYDPDVHFDVPAMCFGPVEVDITASDGGQHLRPEQDLGFLNLEVAQ